MALIHNPEIKPIYTSLSEGKQTFFIKYKKVPLLKFLKDRVRSKFNKYLIQVLTCCIETCFNDKHRINKFFRGVDCVFCKRSEGDLWGCQELGCDNFCQFVCKKCSLILKEVSDMVN